MTLQEIKFTVAIDGLDEYLNNEKAGYLIKEIYPLLRNQFNSKRAKLIKMINPFIKEWKEELVGYTPKEYNEEIRKRQLKIVEDFNRKHKNDIIVMDVDEKNEIIGHIKNLNNGNNKIYVKSV